MDHLTYIVMLSDHVQGFIAHILRMRSGKADTHFRHFLGDKRNFLPLFFKEIRVDILPQ